MRRASQEVWVPRLSKTPKVSLYLAIVDAIASDIQSGRLVTGERMTPQRELAQALDVNYATVSRAYGEAQRRGLIYSRVGQGTFVCKPRAATPRRARGAARVDMTMNMPPEPDDAALSGRLARGMAEVGADLRELLRYQDFGGGPEARRAAARWLSRTGVSCEPARILACPGIQVALVATLSSLVKPGDVMLCEEITYPGVKAIASQLGIRLVGLPMDAEGVRTEAFVEACQALHPKLFYCNPTLQNPTTCTVSPARRRELAHAAQQHGLAIVEDDPYGVLPTERPIPFAALLPEATYYVTGFSKCVGAGLRVAYLLAPDARRAERLAASLRATSVMASPITVALATRWVEDGSAELMREAIRLESVERQRLVRQYLPANLVRAHPEGFHIWLELPAPWTRASFVEHLRGQGVHAVPSDGFVVGREPPEAVRICLGGPVERAELERGLAVIRDALERADE